MRISDWSSDLFASDLKIQGIAPADPQGSYPRLLEATGMRPPEDSGGPWGYAEKLAALTDPAHEYHDEAVKALGDDHDSHAQPNIAVIHARFAALANKWSPRPRKPNSPKVNADRRSVVSGKIIYEPGYIG